MANISGVTRINGVPTECTVRVYRRDTGILIDEQQSVGGFYSINGLLTEIDYDIVCIGDSSVCPHISGPLKAFSNISASLYWRIYVNKFVDGPIFHGLNEIEMADTISGPNLCSGGTVSSSIEFSSWTDDRAFNGVKTSGDGWLTGNSAASKINQWIVYEFPSEVLITEVRIQSTDVALTGGNGSAPESFIVQYSANGVDWEDASQFDDQIWTPLEEKSFIFA